MTDQATRVVPAGWYEDPSDSEQVRWWNGINWTENTQEKPPSHAGGDAANSDEPRVTTSSVPIRTHARSTSTAESWMVAFTSGLLAVALLGAFLAWLYLGPSVVWGAIALALVYGLSVLLAILDRRKLARWGHTPPPVATTLLTAPVYLLVRAIRLPRSWGQFATSLLLAIGLIGAPVGAWFGGALGGVETAVRIQSEIRDELVSAGTASAVSCPPIADTTTVGSVYACNVTLVDGSERTLWVSIDTVDGGYSYAFGSK